jgi:hypothetical protein
LNHLYQRGLKGEALELIIVDGGRGLLAALDLVYGQIPLQRCWAHKTRNVLNSVKWADQLIGSAMPVPLEKLREPLSALSCDGKGVTRGPSDVFKRIYQRC